MVMQAVTGEYLRYSEVILLVPRPEGLLDLSNVDAGERCGKAGVQEASRGGRL